jgi:SHS2 domain-containing protein
VYEIFEHTADVGIRARAESLGGLFEDAARGFVSLIVADPTTVRPSERREIDIHSTDLGDLLLDWLNELLFEFDTARLILADFQVDIDDHALHGIAAGEVYDPDRHQLDHEIKAITYHGLDVSRVDGDWEASVIVDV